MKNSKEHAQRLQRLYRELKRAHPAGRENHLRGPGRGLDLRYHQRADERVRRPEGLPGDHTGVRGLERSAGFPRGGGGGGAGPQHGDRPGHGAGPDRGPAENLRRAPQNQPRLTLKKLGKRPARQDLEKIDGISRFVVNYCLLTSLEAHAIPVTEQMADYLRQNGDHRAGCRRGGPGRIPDPVRGGEGRVRVLRSAAARERVAEADPEETKGRAGPKEGSRREQGIATRAWTPEAA